MAEHPTTEQSDPARTSAEEIEREQAWQRARDRAAGLGTPSSRPVGATIDRAFAALAENVRDYAIFLIDPDGRITFWGEGARLMKWWTREEAEGSHLRMLYPPGGSDDGTAEDHLVESADRGEYSGEGRRVRSDGSTFWAGITLTALRDEDGRLLGFAKVTRDLTARRAADAIVQAAAAAAEAARAAAVAADAAKSGFLATMSHEIRTPINGILGYHQLLEMGIGGPLTARQRDYLTRAAASGRHLLTLVNEVLDFSRIDAGHVEVSTQTFRVGDAVTSSIELVATQAAARQLDFVNATSGLSAGQRAIGDASRVRQVLVNLLANAVKFTEPGGRITISAGTAEQPSPDAQVRGAGPWIYVRVEDTGIGIAPERQAAVFEPFVQGDMALTRAHGGTGLGLAISRRLARLMDGDLTLRSEVGVGSAFFLWLPAAPETTMATGGLQGDAPAFDDVAAAGPTRSMHDVSDALLAELERTLHAYVARLRADPETPSAHDLDEAAIEDHLATFLADVANVLGALDSDDGELVHDSSDVQRLIASRHGTQRARLGWSERELRRDFTVVREELSAALRRHNPRGPTVEARAQAAERAEVALGVLVAAAERVSLAAWKEECERVE